LFSSIKMANKNATKKKTQPKKKTGPKKKKKEEPDQPEINIGLVGHVDHGKTTLTEKLSGKWTDTHSEELKRGITIRLGYADATFRKCPKCKGAEAFTTKETCEKHKTKTAILRTVSFVDAPGHESLMATMLSGAAIMDGALLLIAANEFCPQPQTREHLMALEISGVKNIVIIQNKIDVVGEERILNNFKQIKNFIKGTIYENAPIIPVSAQHGVNIDAVIEAIQKYIPTPERNPEDDPLMLVARSFDINKPGTKPEELKGGVLGGALAKGRLKVGDRIEIRPGRVIAEANKMVSKPLFAEIVSIMSGSKRLEEAGPGGNIGLLTKLDPNVVKSDSLTGNIVGLPGKLPKIWYELALEVHLLERVVGSKEELKVEPVKMQEVLMLNVNSAATVGFVNHLEKNKIKCKLKLPVCADPGSRVTISRRIGTRFRLIGYGIIQE
jgi:translation initiation factor 2 subunit 3